jgi:hypothetical protein
VIQDLAGGHTTDVFSVRAVETGLAPQGQPALAIVFKTDRNIDCAANLRNNQTDITWSKQPRVRNAKLFRYWQIQTETLLASNRTKDANSQAKNSDAHNDPKAESLVSMAITGATIQEDAYLLLLRPAAQPWRLADLNARAVGCSRWLGGGLTCSAEIPVADESDKNDDHERREEKELTSGENERQREHQ